MLSACLLFIYGVNGFFRRLFGTEKSRFTTWRRTPSQRRPHLGAETVVARPRCGRRWEQRRARLVLDSPKGMGIGLGGWEARGRGGLERWGVQNTEKFCAFFCLIRRCDEALGRSTVAHFARKVRGANIVAAKHELIIQQSHVPERWSCSLQVRGPHFASKVSYNAGAATDDCAGQCKSPLRGRYR